MHLTQYHCGHNFVSRPQAGGSDFNSYNRSLPLLIVFASILFLSCSSIPNQPDISNVAVQAAIKLAQPELEKAFVAQAPIAPSSRGRLPIVDCLPGGAFNPSSKVGKSLSYDSKGNVVLSPGDYIIPVMT
jgi:hypothetical protein